MSLGGFVNDFGSSLPLADSGAIAKFFLGETNEMAIVWFPTPVPGKVRVFLFETEIEIIIGIFAGVLIGKEVLNIGDAHTGVIGHGSVVNDVTGFEAIKSGGGRRWRGRK